MTMNSDNPKTNFTLEMICQQKEEKLAEIRATKQRISDSIGHLFKPEDSTKDSHTVMHNFNSGIAIFNGLITGFKIIKRIRNFFRKK